jgi:hypothetical protein
MQLIGKKLIKIGPDERLSYFCSSYDSANSRLNETNIDETPMCKYALVDLIRTSYFCITAVVF